jgi:hypothetical protein
MCLQESAILLYAPLAVPLAGMTIKRERECDLRHDQWMMRDAIDPHKDAADRSAFQIHLQTVVSSGPMGSRWGQVHAGSVSNVTKL